MCVYSSSSLSLPPLPSSLPPLPHSCQANMDQPELASRLTSSLKASSSKWVSRYRPGVPVPMANARESIVQAELRQREKDFCDKTILRYSTITCLTYSGQGSTITVLSTHTLWNIREHHILLPLHPSQSVLRYLECEWEAANRHSGPVPLGVQGAGRGGQGGQT